MAYLATGQHVDAIIAFEQAIVLEGSSAVLLERLWEARMANGDYDASLRMIGFGFDSRIERGEKNPWTQKMTNDLGVLETVITELAWEITNAWSWDEIWKAYISKGNFQDALRLLDAAQEKYGYHWWRRIMLSLFVDLDHDRAKLLFEKAAEKYDLQLCSTMRSECEAKKFYSAEVEAIETLMEKLIKNAENIKTDDTATMWWNRFWDVCNKTGEYDRATQMINRIMDKIGTELSFCQQLVHAYQMQGDYDNAMKVCHVGLRIYPDDNELFETLRTLCQKNMTYDNIPELVCSKDGLKVVSKVESDVEKPLKYVSSYILLGFMYYARGRHEQAIEAFRLAESGAETAVLYAFLSPEIGGNTVLEERLDARFRNCFIWPVLAEAHLINRDIKNARKVLAKAISGYKTGLAEIRNELLWEDVNIRSEATEGAFKRKTTLRQAIIAAMLAEACLKLSLSHEAAGEWDMALAVLLEGVEGGVTDAYVYTKIITLQGAGVLSPDGRVDTELAKYGGRFSAFG